MNPSANGWTKKLLKELSSRALLNNASDVDFYLAFRASGFIYGYNIRVVNNYVTTPDFTEEERCKINLCLAFIHAHKNDGTAIPLFDSVINFYTAINQYKSTFLEDVLGREKAETLVEKILHKRVQIDDNIITKNFNHYITNVLLYLDVIAYKHYLKHQHITQNYLEALEASIITIVINALNLKQNKSNYDKSLIELFEASLRYRKQKQLTFLEAVTFAKSVNESLYFSDIACMAAWSDNIIETAEFEFLNTLAEALGLTDNDKNESLAAINSFFSNHRNEIRLLSSKNVVKSFYNRSNILVTKLITRNKKRLLKELRDSKELVVLLSQSTYRELTAEEHKKINKQLLDIFKTIPSLAIFLLPGGAILLPIVIKFIPKLLPSAFDDNRIDNE
ncbi:LETM1-related biofilm-associated protein [Formosa sp. A9]|uniref:LETM1-related biofilm-associated protein n=1 Tax=Formosa sp. A9 TaxID=3442641 RepID=UPI003EBF3393